MPTPLTEGQKIATINTEYIEMDKLLKREDLAASGGEARYQISQGLVAVNGVQEMRKRRKLYAGDVVCFAGVEIRVEKEQPPVSH
ncbi:MAG: RNA-binding S4 domain-containing protein [Desulfobulbaceae bacterium]|jgi:ribosome-associated protein|nr:RNA-binding S4 domain-containing protein [Desulfobulbaceae bacterium]